MWPYEAEWAARYATPRVVMIEELLSVASIVHVSACLSCKVLVVSNAFPTCLSCIFQLVSGA